MWCCFYLHCSGGSVCHGNLMRSGGRCWMWSPIAWPWLMPLKTRRSCSSWSQHAFSLRYHLWKLVCRGPTWHRQVYEFWKWLLAVSREDFLCHARCYEYVLCPNSSKLWLISISLHLPAWPFFSKYRIWQFSSWLHSEPDLFHHWCLRRWIAHAPCFCTKRLLLVLSLYVRFFLISSLFGPFGVLYVRGYYCYVWWTAAFLEEFRLKMACSSTDFQQQGSHIIDLAK